MPDRKLRKISDRLYEEDGQGRSKPLKWSKEWEPLSLNLYGLKAIEGFSMEMKDLGPWDFNHRSRFQLIVAKGEIANSRSVQLIDPEGDEHQRFDKIAVTVRRRDGWDEISEENQPKIGGWRGSLTHESEEDLPWDWEDRCEPYLSLDVPVPPDLFDPIWTKLMTGRTFDKAMLSAWVEVLQSEMERSLAESDDWQKYSIEQGSSNRAVLSSLHVVTKPATQMPEGAAEELPDGTQVGEGQAEEPRKLEDAIQAQATALASLARSAASISTALKAAVFFLIIGVVALFQ